MKKRITIFMLCLMMLFSSTSVTYAHKEQGEHDVDLRNVLFGEGKQPNDRASKAKFQAIANAASLCIDQYSINETIKAKKKEFDDLDKRIHFSFSFDDIELVSSKVGNKPVGPNTHRSFTHRGWDFTEYPDLELWKKRKMILTATVNKELFSSGTGLFAEIYDSYIAEETACNKQCEALCKLIYYVHILGDYEEGISKDVFNQITPLYRLNDSSSPTIIGDIIALLPDLFKPSHSRSALKDELILIQRDVEKVYRDHRNGFEQEQRDECCKYARDVLKWLIIYIPGMLKETDFFQAAFYANKNAA